MTLRMGDGPPANLPPGLDAYAGYTDNSGIGVTYPQIVARFPAARHLSISVHGLAPAECADVENGALSDWTGYTVGYCTVSNVNALVAAYGRPRKLWTAHHNDVPHICSPACWPGLVTTADGTQWTDHGGAWDESLLVDNFFDFQTPPPLERLHNMQIGWNKSGNLIVVGVATDNGNLLQFVEDPPGTWRCIDVTDATKAANPADPRTYQIKD